MPEESARRPMVRRTPADWARMAAASCPQPSDSRARVPDRRRHRRGWTIVAILAGLVCCSPRPFRSEVPILEIDSHGRRFRKDAKVDADLVIHFDPRESTQTFDSRTEYQGGIAIQLLGHSSLHFRKKSYALELRGPRGHVGAAPLLGMPADNNWVLHGPYSDQALMRNYLAYALAGRLRLASPRPRFVELYLRQFP